MYTIAGPGGKPALAGGQGSKPVLERSVYIDFGDGLEDGSFGGKKCWGGGEDDL